MHMLHTDSPQILAWARSDPRYRGLEHVHMPVGIGAYMQDYVQEFLAMRLAAQGARMQLLAPLLQSAVRLAAGAVLDFDQNLGQNRPDFVANLGHNQVEFD